MEICRAEIFQLLLRVDWNDLAADIWVGWSDQILLGRIAMLLSHIKKVWQLTLTLTLGTLLASGGKWSPVVAAETAQSFTAAPTQDASKVEATQTLPVPTPEEVIDYQTDILPILRAACWKCHNQEIPSGGLRLDTQAGARSGGASKRPILGGTRETNELLRRVISSDPEVRMPLGGSPLSSVAIRKLEKWVGMGSPWPDDHKLFPNEESQSSNNEPPRNLLDRIFGLLSWLMNDVRYFWHFLAGLLALQGVAILLETTRTAARKNRPWTLGRGRWLARISSYFGVLPYLFALSGMLTLLTFINLKIRNDNLRNENKVLSGRVKDLQVNLTVFTGGATTESVYGNPPRPYRMSHPRQVQGVYYRGNDERNEKLFNNGNYRTAVLRIGLENSRGELLNYGDAVPADGLSLRFEVERAPFTSDALFSEPVLAAVRVSRQAHLGPHPTETSSTPDAVDASLVPVKGAEGKIWRASYPLFRAGDVVPKRFKGMVYVRYHQAPSYGIGYDLDLEKSTIGPDSDLYLGNLMVLPNLALPQPKKVSQDEWLDYRPIPEMTRPNSQDPNLLGVPEHQRKQP